MLGNKGGIIIEGNFDNVRRKDWFYDSGTERGLCQGI